MNADKGNPQPRPQTAPNANHARNGSAPARELPAAALAAYDSNSNSQSQSPSTNPSDLPRSSQFPASRSRAKTLVPWADRSRREHARQSDSRNPVLPRPVDESRPAPPPRKLERPREKIKPDGATEAPPHPHPHPPRDEHAPSSPYPPLPHEFRTERNSIQGSRLSAAGLGSIRSTFLDSMLAHAGADLNRKTTRRGVRIVGKVARGGIGQILRGEDLVLRRELAVKVLQRKHADDPTVRLRFVEEAQITGQLEHPGVVPVHELGQFDDGLVYFTMQLVQGETLSAKLNARTDPADDQPRFLDIFEKVARTVEYAHSKGLIHRDLKPSNIMVGPFGEVLVMDWGLAKMLTAVELSGMYSVRADHSNDRTLVGEVMGTPAYMSPEQARGLVDEVDQRADVFSLGAILFEILTGRPPYTAGSRENVRLAAKAELDDALARLEWADADPALLELTRSCLAVNKRHRPRDAGEVAAAVADYRARQERRHRELSLHQAREQTWTEEARARNRLQSLLVVGLGIVVLAALLITWRARRPNELGERRLLELWTNAHATLQDARASADLRAWDRAAALYERVERFARHAPLGDQPRATAEAAVANFRAERARAKLALHNPDPNPNLHNNQTSNTQHNPAPEPREQRILVWSETLAALADLRAIPDDHLDPLFRAAAAALDLDCDAMLDPRRDGKLPDPWNPRGPRARALPAALDAWALARYRRAAPPSSWTAPLLVAQHLDPDNHRKLVRSRFLQRRAPDFQPLETKQNPQTPNPGEKPSLEAHILQARIALAEPRPERTLALRILDDAAVEHPRDPRLLLARAAALAAANNDEPARREALALLLAAAQNLPRQASPPLAFLLAELGYPETAAQRLRQWIDARTPLPPATTADREIAAGPLVLRGLLAEIPRNPRESHDDPFANILRTADDPEPDQTPDRERAEAARALLAVLDAPLDRRESPRIETSTTRRTESPATPDTPREARLLAARALALQWLGDTERALETHLRAARRDPALAFPNRRAAEILLQNNPRSPILPQIADILLQNLEQYPADAHAALAALEILQIANETPRARNLLQSLPPAWTRALNTQQQQRLRTLQQNLAAENQ